MNSYSTNLIYLATSMVAEGDLSESIGGLRRTDFAFVTADATVADAVKKVRESSLPYIMLKIGVDHAPGADPFITTIKDFTGLAVYFLLAGSLLGVTT